MRKVIIGIIMGVFSFLLVACNTNKIKFNVNELDSSAIVASNEENIQDLLRDNQNLIIYKSVNQLEENFNKKELSFSNQDIKNKYDQNFFKNKALVIFYNVDSRCGFKYKFKSLVIDNDKLILNITIDESSEGATVLNPRLFFIEINEKLVKHYDKIVYKIN